MFNCRMQSDVTSLLVNSNFIHVQCVQTSILWILFFNFLSKEYSVERHEKVCSNMFKYDALLPLFHMFFVQWLVVVVVVFFQVCSSFAVTLWTAPRPRSTGSMYSSVGETTIPTTLKDTHAQSTLTTLLTTWVSTPPLLGYSSVLTWLTIFTGKRSVPWVLVMPKLASWMFLWIVTNSFVEKNIAWRATFLMLVTYSLVETSAWRPRFFWLVTHSFGEERYRYKVGILN